MRSPVRGADDSVYHRPRHAHARRELRVGVNPQQAPPVAAQEDVVCFAVKHMSRDIVGNPIDRTATTYHLDP